MALTFERKPDKAKGGETNHIGCIGVAAMAPEPIVLLLRTGTDEARCNGSGFLTKTVAKYDGTKYVGAKGEEKKFESSFGIELSSLGTVKGLDTLAEEKGISARGMPKLALAMGFYLDRPGLSVFGDLTPESELSAAQTKFAQENVWFTMETGKKLEAAEKAAPKGKGKKAKKETKEETKETTEKNGTEKAEKPEKKKKEKGKKKGKEEETPAKEEAPAKEKKEKGKGKGKKEKEAAPAKEEPKEEEKKEGKGKKKGKKEKAAEPKPEPEKPVEKEEGKEKKKKKKGKEPKEEPAPAKEEKPKKKGKGKGKEEEAPAPAPTTSPKGKKGKGKGKGKKGKKEKFKSVADLEPDSSDVALKVTV